MREMRRSTKCAVGIVWTTCIIYGDIIHNPTVGMSRPHTSHTYSRYRLVRYQIRREIGYNAICLDVQGSRIRLVHGLVNFVPALA